MEQKDEDRRGAGSTGEANEEDIQRTTKGLDIAGVVHIRGVVRGK